MEKTTYVKIIALFIAIGLIMTLSSGFVSAQEKKVKRSLAHDDYDTWKSIYRSRISQDGQWILYIETPQDGDAELVVVEVKTGNSFRHAVGYSGEGTDSERAANATFSPGSTHVVFLISQSKAEVDDAKKKKKKGNEKNNDKPKKKIGIMDLNTGVVTEVDKVKSFAMPEKSGNFVAYLLEAPPEKKETEKEKEKEKTEEPEAKAEEEEKPEKEKEKKRKYGAKLIMLSLADTKENSFEKVMEFSFSKNGDRLFYIVSDKENSESDGIYCFMPESEETITLMSGKGIYKNLALNKEETVVVFLTDRDDQESDEPVFNLYGWKINEQIASLWVSHTTTPNFPEGMTVSDKSRASISDDGNVVLFGIKEIPESKKDEDDSQDDKAKFDLWHWNDPYPQPQQKKMAKDIKDNTWESVYFINSKTFVKLADENILDVRLSRDGNIAFAQSSIPYTKRVSYYGQFADVYIIEPTTGRQTLVKKELYGRARLSPNGKYVFWFEKGDWYVFDISLGQTFNITESLDVDFERYDWDTPNPKRDYGIAGWTDDDVSILINDRYDIWEIKPDGSSARRITEGFGRKNGLTFRYLNLDPDAYTVDPEKSILLQTIHDDTMDSGFYRDRVNGQSLPEKLIMESIGFGNPQKAKKSEKLLYTRSKFDEYPDLWVSDLSFRNPQKITGLGNQMDPFIWGKAELRDFFSSDGKALKGILIKPDNFDANKKYPLMVYIYETLHQGFNRYRDPLPGSSVNPPYYVSNGYILWMPDIEYDTGYPGKDALKCVLPGIQMLIREGYIDPEAIGIQGHSWGGYQISYMVTQTNIFAAAEAGAPVSNMTSAYGGIRWASGMVRQFQYERTQSRLGDSLWNVPLRYIENSPLFWTDKIETPLMIMHNDEDGAVPWYQGIEFIMALRRLEKEAYMFNYNGEAHGLRKRVNQKDWTIRMAEFFDHHLKGAPMPDWMKNGIKAWEKD